MKTSPPKGRVSQQHVVVPFGGCRRVFERMVSNPTCVTAPPALAKLSRKLHRKRRIPPPFRMAPPCSVVPVDVPVALPFTKVTSETCAEIDLRI